MEEVDDFRSQRGPPGVGQVTSNSATGNKADNKHPPRNGDQAVEHLVHNVGAGGAIGRAERRNDAVLDPRFRRSLDNYCRRGTDEYLKHRGPAPVGRPPQGGGDGQEGQEGDQPVQNVENLHHVTGQVSELDLARAIWPKSAGRFTPSAFESVVRIWAGTSPLVMGGMVM